MGKGMSFGNIDISGSPLNKEGFKMPPVPQRV